MKTHEHVSLGILVLLFSVLAGSQCPGEGSATTSKTISSSGSTATSGDLRDLLPVQPVKRLRIGVPKRYLEGCSRHGIVTARLKMMVKQP
jgi:hypothetical protein